MSTTPRITPPTHRQIGTLLALPGAPARDVADGVDEFERESRRAEVLPSWQLVPKHQLNYRCAAKFLRAADDWKLDRSLAFLGPTGAGKTTACVRIVARLCRDAVRFGGKHIRPARSLYWVDADRLSAAGGEDTGEAKEVLRRATWAYVLVLDDVARPSNTMQRILRHRRDKRLPTIITSGALDEAGLTAALGGKAVYRHVMEATGVDGVVVIATAKDVPRA